MPVGSAAPKPPTASPSGTPPARTAAIPASSLLTWVKPPPTTTSTTGPCSGAWQLCAVRAGGEGGGGGREGCVGREARDVCACEHPRCSSPGRAPPHPPHNAQAATPGAASPGQTAAASSIFALTTGTGSAPTTPAARVLQATCPTTSTEPAVREGGGGGSHVCMGAADCTTPSPTRSPPPTPVRSARQPRVRPAS